LTVTASMALSALVSLTLAPMLCSRFMCRETGAWPHLPRDRGLASTRCGRSTVARSTSCCATGRLRGLFFATMALTATNPTQDTGLISGPRRIGRPSR
jgi:HAE1 family hydrophobic/amphiphilic exporter-1